MYARTSDKINPVDSIPAQIRMTEKYAKRNGLVITDYIKDEMKTGTNQNRAGFQKLLHLVEEGLVEVILVAYFDRLGRNSIQMSSFLMKLKQKGIECISIGQDKKLSQMSEKDIVQEAIYAEAENRNRTNRLHSSHIDSLKRGEFAYTSQPLGYDKNENRKLVPNKDAEFVKTLFQSFLTYGNIPEVKKYLESLKKWTHIEMSNNKLKQILMNKNYLGNIYRREKNKEGNIEHKLYAENSHTAIIDEDTFMKVQELMKMRYKIEKQPTFHLFASILYCNNCGKRLFMTQGAYLCRTKGCNTRGYKKYIEPQVLELLQQKADDEDSLKEKYEEEIKKIEKQQDLLEVDYATLKISRERLNERLFHLNEEMEVAYQNYMNKAYKHGRYKDLIEKNKLKELKEVLLEREVKIMVSKISVDKFNFQIID